MAVFTAVTDGSVADYNTWGTSPEDISNPVPGVDIPGPGDTMADGGYALSMPTQGVFGTLNGVAGSFISYGLVAANGVSQRSGILNGSGVTVAGPIVFLANGSTATLTAYCAAAANVRSGTARWTGATGTGNVGTLAVPAAADVRYGVSVDATTGTISVPNSGTPTGTENSTSDGLVAAGKNYGAGNARTGSYPLQATTQAADAATLTGTTLNAVGADTTIAFGASNGTAKSAAVYAAGQAAGGGGTTVSGILTIE